jgi:hypothetical protein
MGEMTHGPFFIVGYERSGTTLMAAALDRHSRIAVPPETHFFVDVCPALHAGQRGDPQFMVSHFFRSKRMGDLQLDSAQLLDRMKRIEPTWANLFLEALRLYAAGRGKDLIGEKTPGHWRYLPEILRAFPNAKSIWLIRDGRDAVASMMNMPWKRHNNLALHGMQWRFAMERMMAFETQFPGRILRIKFEQLISDAKSEVQQACEFLGVEFEASQLDPAVKTGVVPEWEMAWKERIFSPPDPSRIGAAARELSREGYQLLDLLLAPTLQVLGYNVPATSIDGRAKAV